MSKLREILDLCGVSPATDPQEKSKLIMAIKVFSQAQGNEELKEQCSIVYDSLVGEISLEDLPEVDETVVNTISTSGIIDRIGYLPSKEGSGQYYFCLVGRENPNEMFSVNPNSLTIVLTVPGDEVKFEAKHKADYIFAHCTYFENLNTGHNCFDDEY